MLQLYEMGLFTRRKYVESGFLSNRYLSTEMYIRAVGEERTIQSAATFAQAVYPSGSAPDHFLSWVPVPAPVFSEPDKIDTLLEIRKGACSHRLKRDSAQWDETEGVKLWSSEQGKRIIARMQSSCNMTFDAQHLAGSGDDFGDAMKDVTDALLFDSIEAMQLPEPFSVEDLDHSRELAVRQLLGRIAGTEEQMIYMNGDLPKHMIRLFEQQRSGKNRVTAYHAHRELLYTLAGMFGIEFDVSNWHGFPKGSIPPGSTLFFELHETPDLIVRAHIWMPCLTRGVASSDALRALHPLNTSTSLEGVPACDAQPAVMTKICDSVDCPLEKFESFVRSKLEQVGEWSDLCAEPQSETAPSTPTALASEEEVQVELEREVSLNHWLTLVLGALVVGGVATFYWYRKQQGNHHRYESISTVDL